jgi:hypothetical protein
MKRFEIFFRLSLVLGLLAIIPEGCSSGGSVSIPSNRIYVFSAAQGTLAPALTGAKKTAAVEGRSDRYSLTLENVSKELLWYSERPERSSSTITMKDYISRVWPDVYSEISPNAILDGYMRGQTSNDGLYLILQAPEYDAGTDRLIFQVTLLDATTENKHPDTPVYIDNIKITVLDNGPKDETDDWSFVQVAPESHFESTAVSGEYKLYLKDVYAESYYIGNAPNRRSYLYTVKTFVRNWREIFEDDPPNASMTSYTDDGVLKIQIFTIDSPTYNAETNSVVYSAKLLHGTVEVQRTLVSPTLFIDKVPTGGTHAMQVYNNCQETIWLASSGNCKTQDNPCTKYFDPPKGANVEIDENAHIVFHVEQGWQGRFWPRTGCKFNQDGLCDAGDCCDSGGCVNKDNKFAKACFYSGNPPVLVIEPAFDAPSGNGPIDYFDASMVDGYNVLISIAAIADTYNPSPDPGMDPKYWCTTAGCNSSPTCPEFLKDSSTGNCWSPCQYAVRSQLAMAEQEKLCCSCNMKEVCTCPDSCCEDHYGCSPYVLDDDKKQQYPPNMCCDPWGKLNNNRPWDQKYINYIDDVKKACPEVYAWQFDDFKSTINCRKTDGLVDYKITICP